MTWPISLCATISAPCSRRSSMHRHTRMFTGCDHFGAVLHFCAFPLDGECYLRFKRFVSARAGRQLRNGSLGVMASDGIEPKSTAVGLGPELDLATEPGARVIEMSGVIK